MSLKYESGAEIAVGDQVRYHEELGRIEFIVEPGGTAEQTDWYLQELGPGVMILEPKVFGRVFVTNTETEPALVFVARADTVGDA
jgi:hypothetical protein